ncbi:transcription elongation factor GreB [Rhodocyclus tenuis]|uniref:Transcription elongation factor GreB n=2 Tax=Rhodocyclus TaxID=1064 RepID=A0A6L5JXG8_RHOTE|nr:transcription elongation factor GreB [Rhodocyclus gracilis]MQY50898.1 transcription elongation factor GreB [Rhodocyclus gracilis]MRD72872.1 transcription elongation factor GreB [Rhodocyclus gracilis]NJA90077.1 transcription elongation factor GreB [Rhodocyclus gracilis]
MSKAFTRESDEDEDEDGAPAAAPPLPAGTRNYITPQGHARLKAEVEHLLRRERPQMVEVVAWAASNGDRSENGDYLYGKKRLREIDRRIRFLTKRLDLAEVVDPALRQGCDQVFFGATVTLTDEEGEDQTFRIVGVDETDLARGWISWVSPLARALLRARVGDLVRFQSPAGWREVEVSALCYEDNPA